MNPKSNAIETRRGKEAESFFLSSVEIAGFWGRKRIEATFFEDTTIFIGPNGSGKTTFIEILRSCLAVDLLQLAVLDFQQCVVTLASETGSKRTIKIERGSSERRAIEFNYQISTRRHQLKALPPSERDRAPYSYIRRYNEEAEHVRRSLSALVSLSSISVYRADADFELRRRKENIHADWRSAVDFALHQRIERLNQHRLALFEKQNQIQRTLREEVLLSLLDIGLTKEVDLSFVDDQHVRSRLASDLRRTFIRLGVSARSLGKRIDGYLDSISSRVGHVKRILDEEVSLDADSSGSISPIIANLIGERYQIIQSVTSRSLSSDDEIKKLHRPLEEFISTVNSFFEQKTLSLGPSGLVIESRESKNQIPVEALSSGEKQILILLTEVFLQHKKRCVFITDEPELSLHIGWQRELLVSVKNLNPLAQIIVATHSPEIASSAPEKIIDMREVTF